MGIQITKELIEKIDEILARGLSKGLGKRDGQMCVEAAICAALGEDHGDSPSCVASAVRSFKIRLNDSIRWISPESRAKGMRSLAIAQLGSRGTVGDMDFSRIVAEKTIRRLIPTLFRELFSKNEKLLEAADRCEKEGTKGAAAAFAAAARDAASYAPYAADAASYASYAARVADASYAASTAYAYASAASAAFFAAASAASAADAADVGAAAARDAARDAAAVAASYTSYTSYAAAVAADAAAVAGEKYLLLSAQIALETLRELGSPGCEWL
jgi:hypothetical protein